MESEPNQPVPNQYLTLYKAGKSASAALAVVAADPPVTSSILQLSDRGLLSRGPARQARHPCNNRDIGGQHRMMRPRGALSSSASADVPGLMLSEHHPASIAHQVAGLAPGWMGDTPGTACR